MDEPMRLKIVDVDYALKMLDSEMNIGFDISQKNRSDLEDVRKDIEVKICFLYELGCIGKEEFEDRFEHLQKRFLEERRKRDERRNFKVSQR